MGLKVAVIGLSPTTQIGVARGKGIKVYVPDESPLCKFQGTGIKFYRHEPVYQSRYGWLG